MIPLREPIEIAGDDRLADTVNTTAGPLFAWLCRVIGSAAATDVLPRVYGRVAEFARRDGVRAIDGTFLLTIAFRLALDSGSAADGRLTPTERALLDLHSTQGFRDAEVATILRVPEAEVGPQIEAAAAALAAMDPSLTPDEFLRQEEVWLDDVLRDRCRQAALGGRAASIADASARSRGRRVAIAMAASVAVIVGIIAWTTTDNAPQASSPATFPPSGPVDVSSTITHPIMLQRPGYILPTSAVVGLRVRAEEFPTAANPVREPTGWFDVWAEPTATHFHGRWFAAVTSRCNQGIPMLQDARRVTVGDRHALLITMTENVLQLSVEAGDTSLTNRSLEMVGHGFTEAQFIVLAASVQLDLVLADPTDPPPPNCGSAGVHDGIQFDDSSRELFSTLREIESVPARGGRPIEQLTPAAYRTTVYSKPDQGNAAVTITTNDLDPHAIRLAQLLLVSPSDPDAPISPVRTIDANGRSATVSAAPDQSGEHVALVQFDSPSDSITLAAAITSQFTLTDLIELAGEARPATIPEWYDITVIETTPPQVVDMPVRVNTTDDGATTTTFAPVADIQTYADGTGTTWELITGGRAILGMYGGSISASIDGPLLIDPDTPVLRWETPDETILLIALVDPGAGTRVRVTVGDTPPEETRLSRPAPDGPAVAVVRFTQTDPYRVELLDDIGSTVRVLAP